MKTLTKPLKTWNSDDISSWLVSIGMKPYVRTFKANKITGRDLCAILNENDLKTKCKIHARPVRNILYKRLKHIQGRFKSVDGEGSDDDTSEVKALPDEDEQKVAVEEEVPPKEITDHVQCQLIEPPVEPAIHECQEEAKGLSPDDASFAIQGLFRCMIARRVLDPLIRAQYRKVYSLETGRFVYKYVGSINTSSGIRIFSKLLDPTGSTFKLIHLRGDDIRISFTVELATLRIQLFARYCVSIKKARALSRQLWRRIFDPLSGRYFYYLPSLGGVKSWKKPKILGNERWNPMNLTDWTEDDVRLYFRRLGLVKYGLVREVHRFKINGKLLLSLDQHDLFCFHIPENATHRIMNAINNSPVSKNKADKDTLRRRNILRTHFHLIASAITIQRYVRGFLYHSKIEAFMRCMKRCKNQKQETIPHWWSDRNLQFMVVVLEGSKKRKTCVLECPCNPYR